VSEKFAFIDAEKAMFPIVKMCAWLDVSTSGFYEWVNRPASANAQRRKRLAALIQAIFDESDGTYGYRRVHAALARQGDDCGPELVRDLMRELGLIPCQPRPWRPTTTQRGKGAEAVPDLVGRDFSAQAPGTKMVGDITYLPTWEGFAYLATVIDCATKECTGYAIADHMRAELVINALRMAARNHDLEPGAIFRTEAPNISARRSSRSPLSSIYVILLAEWDRVSITPRLNRSTRRLRLSGSTGPCIQRVNTPAKT